MKARGSVGKKRRRREKLGNISYFWEISLAIIFVVLRLQEKEKEKKKIQ